MRPLLVFVLLLAASARAQARPDVVLIIADDQAWTDFGFMGHDVVQTPNLDRLAAESAVFPHGYVPSSLCRPSLASIVTGLYPQQHGITGNDPPAGVDRRRMLDLIRGVETLPRRLGAVGYRSLQTGKWWEGSYRLGGFTDGMTHGDPARGGRHGDRGLRIGRKTMRPIFDFVDECAERHTPFLLWYAPFLPHRPHDPPQRLLRKYRGRVKSESLARYYACCEWFDETCGKLLAHLDQRGLRQNTLVVFVVDNGWIQDPKGKGFAKKSKRSPFDGGVRTPIMLRGPGKIQPGRHDTLVSSVDLFPTILSACGVKPRRPMPGIDLLGVCRGEEPGRKRVFGAIFTHDVVDLREPARSLLFRYVVEGRFKLITPALPGMAAALYDLDRDPHETENLARAQPDRAQHLRAALDRWWPARPARRPNILFLLTDDQRADALGCAGNAVLRTPNLDRLAARGSRFVNAFVTTSICAASRASILTGLQEHTHGYTFRRPPLAARFTDQSYPSLLRAAGYRTGFVGKWGVRVVKGAAAKLFDVFTPLHRNPYFKKQAHGLVRHLTDITGDRAIAFLRGCVPERPFCLSVSFNAPHAEDGDPAQYLWPHAEDGLYEDAVIAPPANATPEFFARLPAFQRRSLNRMRWRWRFDEPDKYQRMVKGYYRMITGVDRVIGRILAELERLGFADDTVVIASSDNGYFLGERGFAGKWLIHEESIRVPLILFDPRAKRDRRGAELDQMALNLDLPATILDLAGVPVPPSYQGRSLLGLLRGKRPPWRQDFYYEHRFDHPDIPKSEGVRGKRWVYARYFEQDPVFEALYDLEADPHEARNLARDPARARILERLRARCAELGASYR